MPISWVEAYDLELLFGDLAGPCRGPSLRDEFSLDIFTSEGTHFQLKKLFRKKNSKEINIPENLRKSDQCQ